MRIVVDLQACQSRASRTRGIGRYSLSLLEAMLRNVGEDEIWIALNGELPGTVEPIRAALNGSIPDERIVVWKAVPAISAEYPANDWRRAAAAEARQTFLQSLAPDVVHVSSWFEGFIDDTLTAPGVTPPDYLTAVTLYDLIPLVHAKAYLEHPRLREWYLGKIEVLKRAGLLLGISAHTCREAVERLAVPADNVVNISAAIDPIFRPLQADTAESIALLARFGLSRRFLMYTGGIDHRKNVEGLIRAYARLPLALRRDHPLAIVCSAGAESIERLQKIGADAGLNSGQLVLTGFVSDAELVALYSLCEAFVFPSWHEGFGLPVLEAMACGAAVIGANTSSIPEVIEHDEALFDPHDPRAMAAKMEQVLTDRPFRERLRAHGLCRAALFSWDRCARLALTAMREACARRATKSDTVAVVLDDKHKPLLAYISPLPPERSGVADYSAELLPALCAHYRVEAISDQDRISDPWLREHVPLRSTTWFEEHAGSYDRVLYHIGNGLLHAHMLGMLERHPGVVVLHDLFLSGITSHLEWASKVPGYWTRSLYESHGYPALITRETIEDPERVLERFPCSAIVIRDAESIIVHSQFARTLADRWYGAGVSQDWSVVPLLRIAPDDDDRETARRRLSIGKQELLVCCFGILGVFKRNREIIEAWSASAFAVDKHARLVFVGGSLNPTYEQQMKDLIAGSEAHGRIRITGWVDKPTYRAYLAAADIAVQLRGSSRGETSLTALDCLAHGIPTIVNAHGATAEIPIDAVLMLPDACSKQELADALETLAQDPARRHALGERGRAYCRRMLEPHRIAALYRDAIEAAAHGPQRSEQKLAADIARIDVGVEPDTIDLDRLAAGIAGNQRPRIGVRQLLVDVSELFRRDSKSGIQRVVRSVLSILFADPPDGFRVEPVYAEPGERYRYARGFTMKFLGLDHPMPPDEPIDTDPGDIFFGLDLAMVEIPANIAQFEAMRDRGVRTYFVVHDVLPVARADCFAPHLYGIYDDWMKAIAKIGDGAICVSRTVADELQRHFDALQAPRVRPFHIGWFHHGADIDSSVPTTGIDVDEDTALTVLQRDASLLMVGTLEPRKGHVQAFDAFELLWSQGAQVRLAIVGKSGWMTEALVERLRDHPENGKRLFWFIGASDELLMRLYERCSGLLVASEGEGFGLPLIEAAQHGLPILCRDLPVFREVAGEHASYFSGYSPKELAGAIRDWLDLRSRNMAPESRELPRLNWKQATQKLLDAMLGGHWYVTWMPGQRYAFPVYDRRLVLPQGQRQRDRIVSTGAAGTVLQSWPIPLGRGAWRVRVFGEWTDETGSACVEIAEAGSREVLARLDFGANAAPSRGVLLDSSINLQRDIARLELRVVVAAGTRLAIAGCEVELVAPTHTDPHPNPPPLGEGVRSSRDEAGPLTQRESQNNLVPQGTRSAPFSSVRALTPSPSGGALTPSPSGGRLGRGKQIVTTNQKPDCSSPNRCQPP
ncbi:MAG: glycosyltransferase [Rhodanobacteraceae bacterium]